MKKFRVLLPALMMIAAPMMADAQAFSKDDPIGAEQTFVTTEAAGWVSERSTYKITDKQESGGRTTLIISAKSSVRAAKDSTPVETDLSLKMIYTPTSIIIPKENFTSAVGDLEDLFEGKKVTVTFSGDDPTLPMDLKVGQKLPDTEVKADINIERLKAKMNLKSTDRRVTGQERVTVPAGSFDTFVIEETSTAKVNILIISETEKTTEKSWVVPGRGEVKTVSYDKKGKLMSTTEMISFKK
ncbi:MAG: hypothetical protein J5639_00480 [Bacteroidales bacterium]|nr:hypothetical protein [Bacteroidales bacterium]